MRSFNYLGNGLYVRRASTELVYLENEAGWSPHRVIRDFNQEGMRVENFTSMTVVPG